MGPQVVFGGAWAINKNITLKGSGAGAPLAGFYTSNFNESANAKGPVLIAPGTNLPILSNYSDNENHTTQAWIPVLFEAEATVIINLINRPNGTSFALEGGLFLETILPLATTDSINQNLGDGLDKLNNNLNMCGFVVTLDAQFD